MQAPPTAAHDHHTLYTHSTCNSTCSNTLLCPYKLPACLDYNYSASSKTLSDAHPGRNPENTSQQASGIPFNAHRQHGIPVGAHHTGEAPINAHRPLDAPIDAHQCLESIRATCRALNNLLSSHISNTLIEAHQLDTHAPAGSAEASDTSQTSQHRYSTRRNRPCRLARRRKHDKPVLDAIERRKYITNLSSKHLSSTEVEVLSKGLKFIPSSKTNSDKLSDSLSSFERQNRLRYFFRDHAPLPPHPFRGKSAWIPPRASPHIEAYLDRVRSQSTALPPQQFSYNLSSKEQQVLKSLASDDTLVIKSADKGSGIVVEDKEGYIAAGLEHLSDTSIYEEIELDPTHKLAQGINTYVKGMLDKGIIDNITKNYLTFPDDNPPRTQQLYFLKKIHKNPIAVRPIVSGCSGPTERISRLLDLNLQPEVPLIRSYI